MPSGPYGMLTRGEARKALKKLRELGVKPPRMGYCVTVIPQAQGVLAYSRHGDSVELCRHPRSKYHANDSGYQIVTTRREHGLFGGRRRR